MTKENNILKMDGEVVDVLPNATFKLKLQSGLVILGYVSGKMRQNEIRILLGDQVEVEISTYDLSKGRIVKRR